MKNFREDNTEGYTQKQLDKLNEQFEKYVEEHNYDVENEQELKTATDKFWNQL